MRLVPTSLLVVLALLAAAANAAAATAVQKILTVDADYLESSMPLYATLEVQAARLKKAADGERRDDIELARQVRVSDILTALPEVIAVLASSQKADLVLDRAVAKRIAAVVEKDITADVERELVAQFGGRALELDP